MHHFNKLKQTSTNCAMLGLYDQIIGFILVLAGGGVSEMCVQEPEIDIGVCAHLCLSLCMCFQLFAWQAEHDGMTKF